MNLQTIILAAGKGTRISNSVLPKVLLPLADRPMILHLLHEIREVPFGHKTIVVVGHKYELVQSMLGPGYIYAFQQGQYGTAHAVNAARKHSAGENVLVLYGDMPFIKAESILKLANEHLSKDSSITMFTTKVPHFENEFSAHKGFSRIIRDKTGHIVKSIEFSDASEEERKINEVNPCVYMFKSHWLWGNIDKIQKNKHGEYYLTDIVAEARKQNAAIHSLEIDPLEVFGINTKTQLEWAEQYVKK